MSVPRSTYTMPFGKHKGKTLDQVPPGYLLWLHETADELPAALDRAICVALRDYFGGEAARLAHAARPPDECPRCHERGLVELDPDTAMYNCAACAATWRAEP